MLLKLSIAFKRLSPRERIFLLGGGGFVGLALTYVMVVSPLLDRLGMLDRLIAGKQSAIGEMRELQSEYLGIRDRLFTIERQLAATSPAFSLLAFLEDVATKAEIKSHIVSMRPQSALPAKDFREQSVEVKIDRVPLAAVVALLREMHEAPAVLRFKRLHLRARFDDPRYLDVDFLVSTYERI